MTESWIRLSANRRQVRKPRNSIHRPATFPYPCAMTAAQAHTFDWPRAIARNRDTFLRIVAVLFVYAGQPRSERGGPDFPGLAKPSPWKS